MSTKKKRAKGSSYEAVNNEDDEEEKYQTVEMGGDTNTNKSKPKTPYPLDEDLQILLADTNAPPLIRAFSEVTFKQHESQKRIKNRLKKKKINAKEAEGELKKAYKTLAHTFDKQQLTEEFNTSLTHGLTNQEINTLQSTIGFNELTPPKKDPEWLRFLKCTFGNLMSILLSVGAILSLIAYGIDPHTPKDYSSLILGFVLIGVVVITGLFIFHQEGKSSNLMSALSAMKPADIVVIRSGKREHIEPRELVPGDLCYLDMGMLIPADLRVIECSLDLEVDNSSLTGESDPQKRSWKPESSDVIPAESKCLCFFGTLIINGKGIGMVIQTGDNTFMGRTAALASSTESTKTPIQREIHSFVTKIAIMAITVGLLCFIAFMLINPDDWITNVILLIGIVITNVPEELMAVVTVQLTLTAQILFRKNVQVKQLGSVETLGSISVICSDKTGTLTTNCMTVQHIYYDFKQRICDTIHPLHALDGDFYETKSISNTDSGGTDDTIKDDTIAGGGLVLARQISNMAMEQQTKIPCIGFLKLVRCGALCNNAAFIRGGSEMDPSANATEAAIVKFSSGHITADYRLNLTQYRDLHKKLHEIPFNSKNKWQISIHELPNKYLIKSDVDNINDQIENKKRAIVQMKGAPERILKLCDKYAYNGEILELNDKIREQLMDGVLELGGKGERVLAFAELILDENKYDINCEEPQIEEKGYDDTINEEYAKEDCVVINYNDKQFKIDINLCDIIVKQEDNEPSSQGVTFENVKIGNLMECISKIEDIDLPTARQRIAYKDKGIVDSDYTFGELGISRGSLLHLFCGPYIFSGGQSDDINIPFNRNIDEGGLIFIGLFAMIDPPRPGVPEAISDCQSAGIKVIMVTGDHPVTAEAIAEKVGIINENTKDNTLIYDSSKMSIKELKSNKFDAIVVPGWELQTVLDQEPEHPQGVADFWNSVLNCDNVVFARTSPQQKLLIVSAVQERGAIVAVTGDGVNDSPALKKADIGIAMGITGTEVAKEAANMILLDDNFTTIVKGIEQGRIIFDNLKKSIAYSLGKNMPEVIPFIVYLAFGCPIPLTPLLLLAVDLGTDIMPSISLAMQKKEFDIMLRKPRDPKKDKLGTMKLILMAEAIFGIFAAFGGLYAYFTVLHSYGLQPSHLINGIDRSNVWSFYGNQQQLRDAYYLWCFDPDITTKCYYYPNFNDSYIPHIYHGNPFPYYNQYQWYQWQMNDKTYAQQSKNYLIQITNNQLTNQMLNGQDINGTKCCNTQYHNGSVDIKCINERSNGCKLTYLSWNDFLNKYWAPKNNSFDTYNIGILNKFNNDIFISNVYHNRPCENEDNFNIYMSPQKNQPPPYCDWTNDKFENGKTKTFKNSPNAFFPMATNTRTEALDRAQTAYLVAIVLMQIANLLSVRTRVASLFQQGMINTFMNYGIICEIFLIAFLVYIPWANVILGSRPLRWVFWTPVVPYFIMVIIYHECRKAYIRKDKKQNKWLTRQTLW